jgi:nucleotide-binding universal stress UspA family protein
MIKSILAPLSGNRADASVLTESLNVARRSGGHIDALRIVPDPQVLRTEAAQVEIGMSAAIADMLGAFENYHAERTRKARAHFDDFCKRAGIGSADGGSKNNGSPGPVTAALRERIGDVTADIIAESRFHDLTVLAGGPERPEWLSVECLSAIIVASGRPVLLAPADARERTLGTIAVAWKSTPESARAVAAALPLLARAEHVHVLGANDDGTSADAMECLDCSEAMTNYLRRHRVKANCHFVIPAGRKVPDAVIEQARKLGADLLVMGGYGHSRTREYILGGFTRRVLDGVTLPVFVVH